MSAVVAEPGTCPAPPSGWFCKDDEGHAGPCPAWPVGVLRDSQIAVTARALNEAYNLGAVEWSDLRSAERAAFTAAAEVVVDALLAHVDGCDWMIVPGTTGLRSLPQTACRLCGEIGWLQVDGSIQ